MMVLRFTLELTKSMKDIGISPLDFSNADPRAKILELVVKERDVNISLAYIRLAEAGST